jgi:hypothetical protein
MDYTPMVLKNKGIPCEFAKLKKVGDLAEKSYNEDGELEKEIFHIKFTNNIISDIELHFGGLEAWQEQLEKTPYTTIRQTLAFALRKTPVETGDVMLDGELMMYSNIIGTAWAVANGVDPFMASQMLKSSIGLADEQKRLLNEELSKTLKVDSSPGSNGSESGPKRAARSKNSGS